MSKKLNRCVIGVSCQLLALVLAGCSSSEDPTGPSTPSAGAGSGGAAGGSPNASSGAGGMPAAMPPSVGGAMASGGAGGAGAGGSGGASIAGAGGVAGSGGAAGWGTAGAGGTGGAGGIGVGSDVVAPKGGTCGTKWTNPGKQGVHDPSIVKQGDTYYLYATGGFGFSTSKDKLTWTRSTITAPRIPAWTQDLGLDDAPAIWACDAQLVGGKARVYYSVSSWGDVDDSAIGLMTNSSFDPAAPGYQWVDKGQVVGSPEGGAGVNVIDPNLFIDDDGRQWLVYGSFHKGIRLIEINAETGLAKTNPPNPITLTTSLGEGSSLIKANGFYYLFVSRGKCCAGSASTYEVVYGRATSVMGPYLNRNGEPMNGKYEKLLAAGADGNPGQGGQSFFKEQGQWYINYHAYQPPNGGSVLNVRPVYFDADGWPTFDVCKAKGYQP